MNNFAMTGMNNLRNEWVWKERQRRVNIATTVDNLQMVMVDFSNYRHLVKFSFELCLVNMIFNENLDFENEWRN